MKASEYRPIDVGGERVLANPSRLELIRRVDAVVFDCDGVLVDTRCSYDATIAKVAGRMIWDLVGVRLPYEKVAPSLTSLLRRTGGFNNDWDTTYALTLFSVLALPVSIALMVARGRRSDGADPLPPKKTRAVLNRLSRVVNEFCSSATGVGHSAVDGFLDERKLSSTSSSAVKNARRYLGYPGSPPQSLMATVFDETYHGAELFKKMYGFPARYSQGKGLIEEETVLVDRKSLERLRRILGGRRIAMATGRPFLAAKHSLHHLMIYFDRRASTYIGDADVHPELGREFEKYRKPSGGSLLRARRELAANGMLYVGDSAEDQMMVEHARAEYDRILFAGVFGTAADEEERISYFTSRGADLVIRRAVQIPSVLEAMKN